MKSRRKFTGNLDLLNVQLMIHPLLQPLRELNGKIKIDESGIDFQNLKALLVGFPASASGRWRFGGKAAIALRFCRAESGHHLSDLADRSGVERFLRKLGALKEKSP